MLYQLTVSYKKERTYDYTDDDHDVGGVDSEGQMELSPYQHRYILQTVLILHTHSFH